MRDALVQVYLHCIWGTWDRLPCIDGEKEQIIYTAINKKCEQLGSHVIALGGMPDHVHLLVRFPATISISEFIHDLKGSTSHLVTHQGNPGELFKWQGAYAVYSVSEKVVSKVKSYILNQKEHHDTHTIYRELEL